MPQHTYTPNREMGDFEGGPLKAKRGDLLLFPPLGGLQDEAQDDPLTLFKCCQMVEIKTRFSRRNKTNFENKICPKWYLSNANVA